jgi:hypothetical protein
VIRTGRCLCGAVRFAWDGPPNWQGLCHCDSCRRATGAPVVAFVGVPKDAWRWTGQPPRDFASSPGVVRQFCPTCGATVTYRTAESPDEVHVHAALLDDPRDVAPSFHAHWDEHLPWLSLSDTLERHTG